MPNLFFHFRPIQERMSRLVCIEESRDRQKLAQTFDERAFTRGNSAGNPNCRHLREKLKRCKPGFVSRKIRQ
jgi:hypothetical protein